MIKEGVILLLFFVVAIIPYKSKISAVLQKIRSLKNAFFDD